VASEHWRTVNIVLITLLASGVLVGCAHRHNDAASRPVIEGEGRGPATPATEPSRHAPEFPGGGAPMPPGSPAPSP
jgi:hypothetical protein